MKAVHVTYWNRWPLERVTSLCLARIAEKYQFEVFAGVSPDDMYIDQLAPHLYELGFHLVECPNRPVGRKHNILGRAIWEAGVEWMLQVGSDDIFTQGFWDHYDGSPFQGTEQCYFVSQDQRAVFFSYGRQKYALGPGRLFSRSLFDPFQGELWPPDLDKRLDGKSQKKIGQEPRFIGRPLFVDIKTAVNVTSFEKLEANNPSVKYEEAASFLHPADKALLEDFLCE